MKNVLATVSRVGVILVLFFIGWYLLQPSANPTAAPERWAVVVPHHDLVKSNRQDFWQTLLTEHPQAANTTKIILIGPDHFGLQQQAISYTDENFTIYNGALTNGLANRNPPFTNVVKNTTLITDDHAVTVLLAELAAYFPNATLAPFLIGDKIKFNELGNLLNFIKDECVDTCLIVASVDFSHGLSLEQADQKDGQTLAQLANMSVAQDSLIVPDNADCPACLYTIQELGRNWGNTWWFWDKTNSANGNTDLIDTVSHIYGGYLPKK